MTLSEVLDDVPGADFLYAVTGVLDMRQEFAANLDTVEASDGSPFQRAG
jgi:hypothetical protein